MAEPDRERRKFLQAVAATAPLACLGQGYSRGDEKRPAPRGRPPDLIVREQTPTNLEMPFETLDSFITPNDRFYVRNHFAAPELKVASWRLRVEGAVERPLTLTYADLTSMPARSRVDLLECAGNGRAFLQPPAKGVQWQLGAVANAEWTGVPLAAVLERAGLRDAAVEVVFEGADRGTVSVEPTLGQIHFARSLPVARARRPEVLLAYRMDGQDLPAPHGAPLRLIVPGWYGMASVKWLTRIAVADRPFAGFWQTLDYAVFERRFGQPVLVPLTEMQVKAQIARPRAMEAVRAGAAYRVHGAAWTGDSDVTRVEVSTDGGTAWSPARLLGRPVRHAWRLWEYTWRVPERAGRARLLARATDARGRTQPMRRDPDRRNYAISHVLPVEVDVRQGA